MNKPASILMDLPPEIVVGILSRLPTRTIVSCRCVCKQWHELLSSPEFVKFHLSVSTPGLLVLHVDLNWSEYRCIVVEHEDMSQLQYSFHCNQVMTFDHRAFISSPADYRIATQGSVHGLLCLRYRSKIDDVIYVCNPITREYISLPRLVRIVEYANYTHYGFGISSMTGQYKVVYMLQKSVNEAWQRDRSENYKCEFYEYLVYTLGTGSWRSIPKNTPFEQAHLCFGVFLNGNLHGLVWNSSKSAMLISCFDLEDESFKPFSPPPFSQRIASNRKGYILRVLDDCLCFCESTILCNDVGLVFWMMKEYGVKESWTRQFIFLGTEISTALPFYCISLIKGYKNGDILFSWQDRMVFYYCSKTKTSHKVDMSAENLDSGGWFKTMLHNSSFVSLESFVSENVVSFANLSGR